MMKAIVQDCYGSADVLELRDIAAPVVGDGDVLVRVHAAGCGPDVWHLMTGVPYVVRLVVGFRKPKVGVRTQGQAWPTGSRVMECRQRCARVEASCEGESVCIGDGTLAQAGANTGVPEVQLFVPGSPALTMPDNLAYQPHRGNWILHEDAETTTPLQGPHNDDLWDCLPDGTDPDLQSGLRVATLNDLTADRTGGHLRRQRPLLNVSGAGVVPDITGWS
jgi:hypothetical protein